MRKKKGCNNGYIWWFIVAAFIWMLIPFLLDKLSTLECVRKINTNFNKDIWFTFWGSYFPATVFGLIALFNTAQIQSQQRQIDELKEKNRFKLIKSAKLYACDIEKNVIGNYSISNLRTLLFNAGEVSSTYDFTKCCLLRFSIKDSSDNSGIEDVAIKSIEWKIAKTYYDDNSIDFKRAFIAETGNEIGEVVVDLFWIYTEDAVLDDIDLLIENSVRLSPDYMNSTLKLKLSIKPVFGNEQLLNENIELVSAKDDNALISKHYYNAIV